MQQFSNYTVSKLFYCVGLYACFLAGCNTGPASSTATDKRVIREISGAREKAFNEGNAAAIAIHFTDDALLMAPGKPVI